MFARLRLCANRNWFMSSISNASLFARRPWIPSHRLALRHYKWLSHCIAFICVRHTNVAPARWTGHYGRCHCECRPNALCIRSYDAAVSDSRWRRAVDEYCHKTTVGCIAFKSNARVNITTSVVHVWLTVITGRIYTSIDLKVLMNVEIKLTEKYAAMLKWDHCTLVGQGRWKVPRVSYIVQKFHELWSTNGLKPEQSFYPPLPFCSVPVHLTPMQHSRDGATLRL